MRVLLIPLRTVRNAGSGDYLLEGHGSRDVSVVQCTVHIEQCLALRYTLLLLSVFGHVQYNSTAAVLFKMQYYDIIVILVLL